MTIENRWGIVKATAPPKEAIECAFSIGEQGFYEAIVKFLQCRFPKIPIINGQNNRSSLPKPPFILIQTIAGKRLSTDETRYSDDKIFIKIFSEKMVRIDFYGNAKHRAADMATRFNTLWNNDTTSEFFSAFNIPLHPLYCDDVNLRQLVNSEDQYSDRYSCTAYMEYHPEVQLPQKSATELMMSVGLADTQ